MNSVKVNLRIKLNKKYFYYEKYVNMYFILRFICKIINISFFMFIRKRFL